MILLRFFAGALLACAAIPAAAETPIDQASWVSLKKQVRLPNGLAMSYVELGDPKGEPLLLLHGYTDSSRSWSLVAPYLARYRLLIPDQRGHGGTDAPECCYSTSQFAYDARLFLDAVGVKRTALAGHSLGSLVAMTLAADDPDRVSKVILIGSTALAPVKRGDWLYDNATAVKVRLDPASQFAKDWHPANQPTPVDPSFAKAVNEDLYRIQPHVWRSVMRELASVPGGRHAADIKAPVLVISGGKDSLFPAEHHQSLMQSLPQARGKVFADLGHNPNWERPAEVAAEMSDFLD